jgi:hypothetical protein
LPNGVCRLEVCLPSNAGYAFIWRHTAIKKTNWAIGYGPYGFNGIMIGKHLNKEEKGNLSWK